MPITRTTIRPRWRHGTLLVLGLLACTPHSHAVTLCTTSATPTVFGIYDPLYASPVQINSTVTVACIVTLAALNPIPYTISLGPSSTSNTMARAMAGPLGARLQYNLFTSASYATVWGNGTDGTQAVAGSVTPLSLASLVQQNHTVYGRIPALQTVRVGAYLDAIMVTVDY
jgi:spore coat protein U-like protein